MNCPGHEDKWLVDGTLTGWRRGCMWRRWFPRIRLAIDNRKPRIADFEPTVFVDDLSIGWLADVESFAADNGREFEINNTGD